MGTNQWFFDNEAITSSQGAAIQWEDDKFFKIEYNGKIFNGEIVEDKTEDRSIKVKINHRVFDVKKGGSLDALISELGLDIPKSSNLKSFKHQCLEEL